ncbi:caspase family protein [Flagellimonas onchidii]|uniref:caspase family protein n=1 Tax=Flagellimonas onchidii TaxID=2562684 RepID=UPI0010A60E4C|nr:caspase family protein [Allomuricauda onchidii]
MTRVNLPKFYLLKASLLCLISGLSIANISLAQEVKLGLPLGHTDGIITGYFDKTGKQILTGSNDKTARLWDVETGKLLQIFNGHFSYVWSAMFDSESKIVITNSYDGSAKFWDVESGELLKSFDGHAGSVETSCFRSEENLLLTGSADFTAKLWDVSSGTAIQTYSGHEDAVVGAAFHPSMELVLTASDDGTARTWNIHNGKLKTTLTHKDAVNSAVFNKNGDMILTSSSDSTAAIWNSKNGKLLKQFFGHTDKVISAVFGPNEKILLTASYDNTVRIWDVRTGAPLHVLEGHDGVVDSAIFDNNGSRILTASWDKTAKLWDVETGTEIKSFIGHKSSVRSAIFSPNENNILTVSSDKSARVWDVSSGNCLRSFKGYTGEVNSAEFDATGQSFVSSYADKTARVWNTIDGKLNAVLEGHRGNVSGAKFSSGGNYILTSSWDGSSKLWNSKTGEILKFLGSHNRAITSAIFGPDDLTILTSSWDKTAKLWDVETSNLLQTFKGHSDWVWSIDMDMDGKKIATASSDDTAKIWDLETGDCNFTYLGHKSAVRFVRFLDKGKIISSSADKKIKIWDVKTGETLKTFIGHKGRVNDVIVSQNGNYILSASDDNYVRLWSLESAKELRRIGGHFDEINSIVFHPKDNTIMTASKDGSIKIFSLDKEETTIRHFIFEDNPEKWLHLHPTGLFDASPEAMKLMYWTKGSEIIEFEQLKERYWLPGLWKKVMAGEILPDVRDMDEYQLTPEVELGKIVEGKLPIHLTKREGGYGKVSVFLNGKRIIDDVRGSEFDNTEERQTLYLKVDDHPYLVDGDNEIGVKASGKDEYFGQGRGAKAILTVDKDEVPEPQFFGVILGVSEYANAEINLKYPAQDATSIYKAVEKGASNLFEEKRTFMYKLTSDEGLKPTKRNIENTFKEIAEKANAEDIIFIYMAGHGITWGGLQGDFHYLTLEATSANKEVYNDKAIRDTRTVSTKDLKNWLKDIAAQKRVVVIDACGSGKAVENIKLARNDDPSKKKALDRMADDAGTSIISGSAADAVSYESSRFGQGLLTYTILQGIRGAQQLEDNKLVDIIPIMSFAEKEVPKLAESLGGIQQPDIFLESGAVYIGILDKEERKEIPLAKPKEVFVRSSFLSSDSFDDKLSLTELVDKELSTISAIGVDADLVFFDTPDFPDSCKLSGIYKQTKDGLELQMKQKCGDSELKSTIKANDTEMLVEQIMDFLKY